MKKFVCQKFVYWIIYYKMVFGLIALAHVVGYNLIGNAIAHGGLTLAITKGFAISLAQCAVAHPAAVATYAAAGYGIKKFSSASNDTIDEK